MIDKEAGLVFEPYQKYGLKNDAAFEILIKTVADFNGIMVNQLRHRCKLAIYAFPRQQFFYFARKYGLGSLSLIGQKTTIEGEKTYDHATVLHASRKVIPDTINTDIAFYNQIVEMKAQIEENFRVGRKFDPVKVVTVTPEGYVYHKRSCIRSNDKEELIVTIIFKKVHEPEQQQQQGQ